jgi:hypothetical protein
MSSLTPREIKRIEELIARLKAKQVPLEEAKRYQLTLEQEKQEAFDNGDILVGVGLLLLGAALVMYLAGYTDSS